MGPASDRMAPESIPRHVLWAATAFLSLFPLFAVNSTSWGMRIAWIGFLLMGVILGFIVHIGEQTNPELHKYAELQRKGPYVRRYRPIVFALTLGALLLAELLSVAATYATPDRPLLWHGTMLIAQGGDFIFPLIGKYATRVTPPFDVQTLYKIQTATTLFLAAGAFIFVILTPYLLFMPSEEIQVMHRMSTAVRSSRFPSSPTSMLIMTPFSILGCLAIFLGWMEFGSASRRSLTMDCLLSAACYIQDDLALIASGFLRIVGSYGFWLGGVVIATTAITADTE